jgi:SAM-dependent methyltransferase
MRSGPLEITDLLWPVDQDGLLVPVVRDHAVEALKSRGQRRAARLVSTFPHRDGLLESSYLQALAFRVHCELQRLGEELQLDRRVSAYLAPHLARLQTDSGRKVTVLDVGCGLGHVVRAMAAHRWLPPDVELVGVDLNPMLIAHASGLAKQEALQCRFVVGDAFAPGLAIDDPESTIVISTGLLHHVSPGQLPGFFMQHAQLGVAGFAHWDIAPCLWSTLGAWVFHQARMREKVSRHDGVLSARRAHPADTLLAAARAGAPSMNPDVLEGPRWYPRTLDVLRPVVGWRP